MAYLGTKAKWLLLLSSIVLLAIVGVWIFQYSGYGERFEIVDELGGNIFPSAILSVATTDAEVIKPVEGLYVGNPKSIISIRLKTRRANSRVRVEVAETPFFSQSVSEFVLDKSGSTYTIYPDIIWKYEALRNNNQAEPVSVAIKVEINGAN